jgi:hypothetical protein
MGGTISFRFAATRAIRIFARNNTDFALLIRMMDLPTKHAQTGCAALVRLKDLSHFCSTTFPIALMFGSAGCIIFATFTDPSLVEMSSSLVIQMAPFVWILLIALLVPTTSQYY